MISELNSLLKNLYSRSSLSHIDSEAVEIGMTASSKTNQERSSPLNMPVSSGSRSTVPVLIESGSYSKCYNIFEIALF